MGFTLVRDDTGVPVAAYDSFNDMLKVNSMQKKWRDSFGGSSLDATKWDSVIGSGGSLSVSSGVLTMGSGTTASAQTYITSKDVFMIPFKFSIGFTLSQRIANQTFIVEMVSVDSTTLVPDGKHCCALLFDGTTVTQAKYRVQNSGMTALDSGASTFPTTASGSYYEIEPFGDECWFHGGTLDSSGGRANSYRRHQQIPDPNALYKLRIRWLNGGSAPASNTNAVIQFIACQDYAELTAEITSGRGNAVAGQAMGVQVLNQPGVTAYCYNNIAYYTDTTTNLATGATFTGTSRDNGSTGRYSKIRYSAYSNLDGTLVIEQSRDGTNWRQVHSVTCQAGIAEVGEVNWTLRYFRVKYTNNGASTTTTLEVCTTIVTV